MAFQEDDRAEVPLGRLFGESTRVSPSKATTTFRGGVRYMAPRDNGTFVGINENDFLNTLALVSADGTLIANSEVQVGDCDFAIICHFGNWLIIHYYEMEHSSDTKPGLAIIDVRDLTIKVQLDNDDNPISISASSHFIYFCCICKGQLLLRIYDWSLTEVTTDGAVTWNAKPMMELLRKEMNHDLIPKEKNRHDYLASYVISIQVVDKMFVVQLNPANALCVIDGVSGQHLTTFTYPSTGHCIEFKVNSRNEILLLADHGRKLFGYNLHGERLFEYIITGTFHSTLHIRQSQPECIVVSNDKYMISIPYLYECLNF